MSIIERAAAKIGTPKKDQERSDPISDPEQTLGVLPGMDVRELTPAQEDPKAGHFLHPDLSGYQEIDLEALASKGFCTPNEPRSAQALEFRRIKRPLLLNIRKSTLLDAYAKRPNLIMVTSALPNEGKTFVAINLAVSIAAELDKHVILVDGDVAKGDVTGVLGIDYQMGLSELLTEETRLTDDLILHTNIEHLSVLPSGKPNAHIDELYASEVMRGIVDELAENDPDRVIIFDAPPLLATTEAGVLSNLMGQVVMVVEADKTPQSAVKDALAHLDETENVSMVLNKTSHKSGDVYGYGYGYGYTSTE